jgi:RNA-splicing ligase RtcB
MIKKWTMAIAREEVKAELHKQGIKLSWVTKHNIDKAARHLVKIKNEELAKRRAKS